MKELELPTFSSELKALIGICRQYLDEEKVFVPSESLNGPELVQLTKHHRVSSQICKWIDTTSFDLLREVRTELVNMHQTATRKGFIHISETLSIHDGLMKARVQHLFIKGPVAASQIYQDPLAKHSRDLDLLIDPSDMDHVIEYLKNHGYYLVGEFNCFSKRQKEAFISLHNQLVLVNPSKQVQVELHWRLFANDLLLPIAFEDLLKASERIALGSKNIPTLNKDDLLLYLSVHGAKHQWSKLYWLVEMAKLIGSYPFDWNEVFKRSEKLKTSRSLVQGLILAESLFGRKAPAQAIQYARADPAISRLVADAAQALQSKIEVIHARGLKNHTKTLLYRSRLQTSWKYKLSLWHSISINDFQVIRLPDSLFYLYKWFRPFFWCWRYFGKPLRNG